MHRVSLFFLYFFVLFFSVAGLAQVSPTDWQIVLLPDTQAYAQTYPSTFTNQTTWIADNKATNNIQLVIGVGDIVNSHTTLSQWATGDAAYDILDAANIPYFATIGNHDYKVSDGSRSSLTNFNTYFGPARYADKYWYRGSKDAGTNENFYGEVTINGQPYLVIAIEFMPRTATLNWVKTLAALHPQHKVILSTHSYMDWSGDSGQNHRHSVCDSNDKPDYSLGADDHEGDEMWEVIRDIPNLWLVISGHVVRSTSFNAQGVRQDLGTHGNLVTQIYSNYQNYTDGGSGYLKLITVKPSTGTFDVKTYSTTLGSYATDPDSQYTKPTEASGIAKTGIGSIKGWVRDATSCVPISGAQVSYSGGSTSTDSYGKYTLTNVVPGQYTFSISKSGYKTVTKTYQVDDGLTANLKGLLPVATTTSSPSTGTSACTLNSAKPSVTICTPTNGASVTSPMRVVAGSNSDYTVSYMQIYLDGLKQYQVSGGKLDTPIPVTSGTHRLTVQAKDASGAIFKQSISVAAGETTSACNAGTLPSVTICSPANNTTVASPVRIVARADSAQSISYMQIYVDGVKAVTVYAKSIDQSLTMSRGTRRVTVQAKQADGAFLKQTIYVNVQ